MANQLDPHHLVALMSYVFWKKQDGSSRFLDPTSLSLEYGITIKHQTSVRTRAVLDSIANILVFKADSQVVAVALQFTSKAHKIRLTIAENGDVDPRLIYYLNRVWEKLQALSNEFAAKGGSDRNETGSPEIPDGVALPLRVQIFREIFGFTLEKQMKRVRKWWNGLVDFVQKLWERREGAVQGVESDLLDVTAGLFSVIRLARKYRRDLRRGLTDDEWQTVHDNSMWASEKAGLVLADRKNFGCETLARELNGTYPDNPPTPRPSNTVFEMAQTLSLLRLRGDYSKRGANSWRGGTNDRSEGAFQLRRALEKLTSLTRHIECLIAFANSPRLRPALRSRMSISTVPGQTRTVELPGSQEQWKPVLEVVTDKILPWQEGYAGELAEHHKENIRVCPAHCECSLIQYLTTRHHDSWDKVPAFSYVGVSKLSCSACRIWLEAFNEAGQRKFYTRGSHGKWYWPWGMPTAEASLREVMVGESSGEIALEKSLEDAMAAKISREYIKYLKQQKLYRSGSDSTDASLSGGKRQLSDAQMESVRSNLGTLVQELVVNKIEDLRLQGDD
ncbi:hypothetical protein C7212DRAFT_360933 [Tuber magnatum]|uniref:Uncharacterized protein n=1 Tax=Tuber magnatum TaxID=42249 RepID=A0A317SZH3_9PEZI|nr:hypothetical protein C7212DRAFT_360933 [Tuber magnatum]